MTRQLTRSALLTGLVAWVVLMLASAPVHAHASVLGTDPADGEVVVRSPATITVRFSEPVSLAAEGNALFDAQGQPVAAEFGARDASVQVTPEDPLTDGTYVLSWRAVSADSHPVSGGITFSVGAPSENVVTVPSPQAEREVAVLKWLAEALRYSGVLLFVGLVLFARVVAVPVTRRDASVDDHLATGARWAGAAALVGALALVPLTALWESGEPLSVAGPALLRSGAAAGAALLIVLAVPIGSWALRHRHSPLIAASLALAVGSLVIVGHTRSYGPLWLVLPADILHVLAAATWLGGVGGLLLVLNRRVPVRATAQTVSRFSTAAAAVVGLLVLTAAALYWRIAGSIEGLWATRYGQLVLVKLAVTAVVVAVGGWNRWRLVPLVAGSRDARRTLRRTLAAEATLLAVVVGVTSGLVAAAPPVASTTPWAAEDSPAGAVALDVGEATAQVRLDPGRRGENTIVVLLVDADGSPLEPVESPQLSLALPAADIGPLDRPLTRTGPGSYRTTADLPVAGSWALRLSVRLSRFEAPVASTELQIP